MINGQKKYLTIIKQNTLKHSGLTTPVSCKIRIFPDLEETLEYARMLESAGCSLLAVHGRTRDQKGWSSHQGGWGSDQSCKNEVRILVFANGNILWLEDVHECIRMTGVDGVMPAESLLENPALFGGHRMKPVEHVTGNFEELSREGALNELSPTLECLDLCEKYPVTREMIRRAHVCILLVGWFHRYPELRDEMNGEQGASIDLIWGMVCKLLEKTHFASMAACSSRDFELHQEMCHLAQLQVMWFHDREWWTASSIEESGKQGKRQRFCKKVGCKTGKTKTWMTWSNLYFLSCKWKR